MEHQRDLVAAEKGLRTLAADGFTLDPAGILEILEEARSRCAALRGQLSNMATVVENQVVSLSGAQQELSEARVVLEEAIGEFGGDKTVAEGVVLMKQAIEEHKAMSHARAVRVSELDRFIRTLQKDVDDAKKSLENKTQALVTKATVIQQLREEVDTLKKKTPT